MNAHDTRSLRSLFGIRFKHFADENGRLVATLVSEPIPDTKIDGPLGPEEMVQVAAAILFRGKDPISGLMPEIERAIRAGDAVHAAALAREAVFQADEVKPADTPTRARGREIALGRLEVDDVVIMPASQLKREITERTILQHFPGGKNLKLRPRQPFTGGDRAAS